MGDLSFPLLVEVQLSKRLSAGRDSRGNETFTYAPSQSVLVHGLSPAWSDVSSDDRPHGLVGDHQLFAPHGLSVAPGDRVSREGTTWDVISVQDWTDGPFGWNAGKQVQMKTTTG